MRESWTDERLDDLNAKVDRRFDRIEARFDELNRILLGFAGVLIVTLVAAQF